MRTTRCRSLAARRSFSKTEPHGASPDRRVALVVTTRRSAPSRALTLSQLAGTVDGRDQLDWLTEQGVIKWRNEDHVTPPPVPKLDDESIPIEQRARAYLDVNCSACHQPGGFAGEATMDLRRTIPLTAAGICAKPSNAIFPGHENAVLLAPGAPEQSLISVRMHLENEGAMPPQRRRADPLGTQIIDAWISSLTTCH